MTRQRQWVSGSSKPSTPETDLHKKDTSVAESTQVFTRADYLSGKCTHRQYYAQFVTENMKIRLTRYIGLNNLLKSKDEYLNDIPLKTWDNFNTAPLAISLMSAGDGLTQAGNVCIAKEAAKQIIEGAVNVDKPTAPQSKVSA